MVNRYSKSTFFKRQQFPIRAAGSLYKKKDSNAIAQTIQRFLDGPVCAVGIVTVDKYMANFFTTDPKLGYISVDSPMARALLGKCVEDEIAVVLPEKNAVFEVLEIDYQ